MRVPLPQSTLPMDDRGISPRWFATAFGCISARRRALNALLVAVAVASGCGLPGAQAQPQAERRLPDARLFFAEPVLGDARLSPDGRQVALRLRSSDPGKARLAVVALDTMKPTVVANCVFRRT